MNERKLLGLIETACKIGHANGDEAIRYANNARILRRAIWRAVHQLRAGNVDAAHRLLIEVLKGTE